MVGYLPLPFCSALANSPEVATPESWAQLAQCHRAMDDPQGAIQVSGGMAPAAALAFGIRLARSLLLQLRSCGCALCLPAGTLWIAACTALLLGVLCM